jgi:hypothetical protein
MYYHYYTLACTLVIISAAILSLCYLLSKSQRNTVQLVTTSVGFDLHFWCVIHHHHPPPTRTVPTRRVVVVVNTRPPHRSGAVKRHTCRRQHPPPFRWESRRGDVASNTPTPRLKPCPHFPGYKGKNAEFT